MKNTFSTLKGNTFSTKFDVIKNKQPITFAYSANYELPENHNLHINHFYEIYVFVKGDAGYIVGDSYFPLKYGDIIIISPYEVHKAVLKSHTLYERFYMLVPTDIFDSFRYNPLYDIMNNITQKKNYISLSDTDRKTALDLLYQMHNVLEKEHNSAKHLLAYGLFLQFVSLISSSTFENSVTHMSSLPSLILDILKYIDTNLVDIDSIEQIATHYGISLSYLSTLFKNTIGTPAIKYIQARKIAYAKSLLDKGLTVTDACFQSGFNDCAYFIKIFKKHIDMTPLQYKKTHHKY